jgi:hypothetical protein
VAEVITFFPRPSSEASRGFAQSRNLLTKLRLNPELDVNSGKKGGVYTNPHITLKVGIFDQLPCHEPFYFDRITNARILLICFLSDISFCGHESRSSDLQQLKMNIEVQMEFWLGSL